MRYAIVSDIHANRQGWEAVINDAVDWAVDATVCLGDIVGYGPMPDAVLESVCEHVDDIVIGNHDAVIGGRLDPDIFSDSARRLIEWTHAQLDDSAEAFFSELPSMIEGDGFVLAHAEILDPEMFGYIDNPAEAQQNFGADPNDLMFVGHTHFPEIFCYDLEANRIDQLPPTDFMLHPNRRYIVNVGSVGDPRDGSALASYCIYDDESRVVTFRHIPFDLDAYLEDMAERRLDVQPYFIMCNQEVLSERQPVDDWAMQLPPPPSSAPAKPAKVIRISRSEQNQDEEQAALAALAKQRRAELAYSLKNARVKAEEKKRAQAEATRLYLRKKQKAAEEARRRRAEEEERAAEEARQREEEEERRRIEAARLKKIELARLAEQREAQRLKLEADRLRRKEAEAEALKQAIEKKKILAKKAAEARKRKEEELKAKAEIARQKKLEQAKVAQQRKLELARAAEQKRLEKQKEREAQAALFKEQLRKKKELARRKTSLSTPPKPPPSKGVDVAPKQTDATSKNVATKKPHETQNIVMRSPKTTGSIKAVSGSPAGNVKPPIPTAQQALPDDPEERKKVIAKRAEEKREQRRQEQEAKKARIREAIKKKQEAARKAREQSKK